VELSCGSQLLFRDPPDKRGGGLIDDEPMDTRVGSCVDDYTTVLIPAFNERPGVGLESHRPATRRQMKSGEQAAAEGARNACPTNSFPTRYQ
jgi:hypothetical protein